MLLATNLLVILWLRRDAKNVRMSPVYSCMLSDSTPKQPFVHAEMDGTSKPADYYDRYSRQYYVIGEHAMNKMAKSNVFISGMSGLGVEIGTYFA